MNTHDIDRLIDKIESSAAMDIAGRSKYIHDLRSAIEADRKCRGEPVDKGPWKAGSNKRDGRVYIGSDDFTHDVRLYVDGDFATLREKLDYAKGIAGQLNAAPVAAQAPFIEHETLRRALSHLGIAAPVSNEELGADMAWYIRRVVEAAAQAPSVPEGWVMVPVQPTEVMKAAGCRALGAIYGHYGAEQCWKAMLDAAPVAAQKADDSELSLRQQYEDACISANANARDAERYRWLRRGGNDDIGVVRGFDVIEYGSSSVASTYEDRLCGDRLDAAIDAMLKNSTGDEDES